MRSGHVVMGIGLVVMGYAVLVIAFARQTERTSQAMVRTAEPCIAETSAAPLPAPPAASSPIAAAPTSSSAPGTSSGAVSNEAGADDEDQEGYLFRFIPGGAGMGRDEALRILAMGKTLAHTPTTKVTIEGYGDLPGTDPLTVGIAKHRAKVGQTILGKAGVTEDRISVTFSDMGSDPKLAHAIRITTTPPLPEGEKP